MLNTSDIQFHSSLITKLNLCFHVLCLIGELIESKKKKNLHKNGPKNKKYFSCILSPEPTDWGKDPTTCKLRKENREWEEGREVLKDKYWQTGSCVCVWLPNWTGYPRTEECQRNRRTGLTLGLIIQQLLFLYGECIGMDIQNFFSR